MLCKEIVPVMFEGLESAGHPSIQKHGINTRSTYSICLPRFTLGVVEERSTIVLWVDGYGVAPLPREGGRLKAW